MKSITEPRENDTEQFVRLENLNCTTCKCKQLHIFVIQVVGNGMFVHVCKPLLKPYLPNFALSLPSNDL